MSTRLLAGLSLVSACSLATGQEPQAIIGGTTAAGDAATVMLAAYPGDHSTLFTCSAVVISPTALLTAAHCLDHTGYTFGVFFDADASPYTTLDLLLPHLAPVSAVHMHPQYDRAAPFTADIAVVQLANATTVAPIAFVRAAPTSALVGQPARIVGYGETTYGTNASTRMQASTVVAALDGGADTIQVGDAQRHTCIGDSGGPALVAAGGGEQVLGVDSYTDTTGCTGPSHFRRADVYAAFIDQYAGTSAPAGPDAGVAPPSPDAGTPAEHGGGGGCAAAGDRAGGALAPGLVAIALRRRRRTPRTRR